MIRELVVAYEDSENVDVKIDAIREKYSKNIQDNPYLKELLMRE